MPVLPSSYRAPRGLANPHVQALFTVTFERGPRLGLRRERVPTPDGDFLDLDWSVVRAPRLLLLLHGLESSSKAPYMRRMMRAANLRGWDALALNFRGCSGEINRLYKSYHSGATEDVRWVLEQVAARDGYDAMAAAGFSLGGNVLLKYLGEEGTRAPLRRAAAVSVPCDLAGSAEQLARPAYALYMRRFLVSLRRKLRAKQSLFPPGVLLDKLMAARTFREVDDLYTAPAHGFLDAEDYWRQCSALRFLPAVKVPTLLLQADDDPFLSPSSYPRVEAAASECLYLEITRGGGHVGFVGRGAHGGSWLEQRLLDFLEADAHAV